MARPLSARQLAAVAVGNALEFYDFLIFGFFATQIGAAFFPLHDAYGRLLLTLATFGVGFMTRPLGGLVIGRMGDRLGRKPAMLLSFGLMGASIIGLALTPPYRSIGMGAPILAVLFRLIQGFALGGEVGPSTAFLLEAAPPARRGFYVAFQHSSQFVAILSSGLIGLALAHLMTPTALAETGWRIAFLIGALVVPFGLWVRRGLAETHAVQKAAARPRYSRAELMVGLLGLFMLACNTISTYVMNYMATYASATLGMPAAAAFAATAATGVAGICCTLLGGGLSDRFGRKPVMIGGAAALLLAVLPVFLAISLWRTPAALILGSGLMAGLVGLSGPPMLAAISESLAPALRAGGLGLVYALAIACFGGTAQFIVTWLIHVTGSPLAPAWYMSAALVVGLAAMALIRETAPVKIGGA
jgi:MHS family citrate/tricarballylate:H+ symporter-like MFS transporter